MAQITASQTAGTFIVVREFLLHWANVVEYE
jgi:hypothetical protein